MTSEQPLRPWLSRSLRSLLLLVASLALLGTAGVDLVGRPSPGPGAGSVATAGLVPPVADDTRGTLAVLRAVLASAGAQATGAAALPPVAGPSVGPPGAPDPGAELADRPLVGLHPGAPGSRGPPVTTGT